MARASEALLLLGHTDSALAYTACSDMSVCAGGPLALARQRGQALAATGDSAAAAACLEKAAAGAQEYGFFMHELQAVLALVTNELGGDEARTRLGELVRQLDGSEAQVAELLQDRDGHSRGALMSTIMPTQPRTIE